MFINIPSEVNNELFRKLFDENHPLWLCGRRYVYLWAKATKTPQSYVFFAEAGSSIDKNIAVKEVRNWCIPLKYNRGLTLGKELKRLKLSFSKTDSSCILPPGCLHVVKDIQNPKSEYIMTDGAGLISRQGLDLVYNFHLTNERRINRVHINCEQGRVLMQCPYTSFQCRIGGVKGMFQLDERLGDGVKLQVLESQMKYFLPQKCRANFQQLCDDMGATQKDSDFDDMYERVDICEWDCLPREDDQDGHLHVRFVQILEHRGVPIEYFKKCADEGTRKFENLMNSADELRKYVQWRHTKTLNNERITTGDIFEDNMLHRMLNVNINRNEPFFAHKIEKFIRREFEFMRKKVKDLRVRYLIHIVASLYTECENISFL